MTIIDKFLKWYNRTWSNWEFSHEATFFIYKYIVYKRVSNDGIVQYRKVKVPI